MFRKLCILGAATFLAVTEAAQMPRDLMSHNKTTKTTSKSKTNRVKTKEVVFCLPNYANGAGEAGLVVQDLPSYLLTRGGDDEKTVVMGDPGILIWSSYGT